jgi:chromosome segregation ATPase
VEAAQPRRPETGCVYVLDRGPGDSGALELTVFERDAFKPIDASVNWLNDNIIVADRLDVAALLSETAAAARADLLATDALDAASAARRDFLRDAASTRERFMKDLDAVISSINRCTFDVLQRAHLAIDGLKALDNDMDSLADIRERASGIASVSDLLNGIDGLTTTLRDRVSALEREVGETLRQADAQSNAEQRRVEAFIQSLEARRADLRTRLRQGSGGHGGDDGENRSADV